jgi:hypothetical protein
MWSKPRTSVESGRAALCIRKYVCALVADQLQPATPLLEGSHCIFSGAWGGDKAWMRSGASTHGGSSRPWSQCEGYGESACNADGVLWTRTLHQGELIVESAASEGRLVGALKDRLVVAAHFKGVRGGPHQGLRVPGLPPPPFFSSDDANIESLLLGLTA